MLSSSPCKIAIFSYERQRHRPTAERSSWTVVISETETDMVIDMWDTPANNTIARRAAPQVQGFLPGTIGGHWL